MRLLLKTKSYDKQYLCNFTRINIWNDIFFYRWSSKDLLIDSPEQCKFSIARKSIFLSLLIFSTSERFLDGSLPLLAHLIFCWLSFCDNQINWSMRKENQLTKKKKKKKICILDKNSTTRMTQKSTKVINDQSKSLRTSKVTKAPQTSLTSQTPLRPFSFTSVSLYHFNRIEDLTLHN